MRLHLPEALRGAVTQLISTNKVHSERSIYLIGTAHISRQSVIEVQQLIKAVKPAVVFIELCYQREQLLTASAAEMRKKLTMSEILQKASSGKHNIFTLLYSNMLSELSTELEVLPGEEFRAAQEAALNSSSNCCVVLGDRPLSITISRVWNGLRLFEKATLLGMLLLGSFSLFPRGDELRRQIEELKSDKDALSREIRRIGDRVPWLVHSLINERDMFMVLELHQVLREMEEEHIEGDVVAVVGAGHVEGMQREWNRLQQQYNQQQPQQQQQQERQQQEQEKEMQQLHHQLQLFPHTASSNCTVPDDHISIADLRALAKAVTDDYYLPPRGFKLS